MKKTKLLIIIFSLILVSACKTEKKDDIMDNPLVQRFETPFEVPPFEQIKLEHFLPAVKYAIKEHEKEIDAIVNNEETATFRNTVEALDFSGNLLKEVNLIFNNLLSANTNEEMRKLAKEIAPLNSNHKDNILLNTELFARIKTVYENRENLDLNTEQYTLLDKTYKNFTRGGANLNESDKEKLRRINEEISLLSLSFGDNVLAEINKFKMIIEDENDLAGLPEDVIKAASETAKEMDLDGKWVFTIHKSSMIPFLQYSEKRDLREKIFKAYINKCDNNDELDNKKIVKKIIKLRYKRARLLGYKDHASYVLEINMAENPENVYALLNKINERAMLVASNEGKDLQEMIDKEGGNFKLQPWDWWYYSEKLRKEKYDLDEEALRPYFKLENVRDGVFKLAQKLYGLQFIKKPGLPVYHEDAEAFEVQEEDSSHVGILYMDFFPRESKRFGAWMTEYRPEIKIDDKRIAPVISVVCNFTKPTGDKPSLLSYEEVLTLFHEFGHALHGLLSQCTYYELTGTNVTRDFVELPSQIMENFVPEQEVLAFFAKHYETGETIPADLVEKINKSSYFNKGFEVVEYIAASFLDMDWHTLHDTTDINVNKFEKRSMQNIGLIPEIVERYRTTYFQHIFSWDYSAGYYSYVWAQLLDSDAYESFRQNGIFDRATAQSFRTNILEKGGSDKPMNLYKKFKGSEPSIEPYLKENGLLLQQ
jgi:peptidyl-dipeptidase Dcp